MKNKFMFSFLIFVLACGLALPMQSLPAQAAGTGYSLRFYGHGTGGIDRVKIRIDAPAVPADVSANFTIEFWLKALLSENNSAACVPSGSSWRNGNVIIDRDINGNGDYGDYGISMAGGKIAFGVSKGASAKTICGATNVADGNWHHIAVTRNTTTGALKIFVDGKTDGLAKSGPLGNISYRNTRPSSYPNSDPFLVFGAEKHDAGAAFRSFSGFLDEVRISKSVRYTVNFAKPTTAPNSDAATVALYHFDEGPAGNCTGAINDSSALSTSDGQCMFGGSGQGGPQFSTDVPFVAPPTATPPPPTATPTSGGGGGGGGPTLAGCPLYPADNIWNTRVDRLPVHARSTDWINSIGRTTGFHMDFGSDTYGGGPIGIPLNIVAGSTVTKYNVSFYYPDESDAGPYPIPNNPNMEFGSDHHILVLDSETCKLYEIYDATFSGGQWSAGSGAIWDLNSHALRPAGWTSADAAGLPILPGLVRYDEVLSGQIQHAIRFTISTSQNSYLWPARHYASSNSSLSVPPMGARLRLKANYNISGFDPKMQVILQAMKTYGIIVADNGSNWYVSGAPDPRWDNDMLHTLDVLTGDNFEAVDVSGLMLNANSGQANVALARWNPALTDTIQIQYSGTLDTTKNVAIYNLDMFDTTVQQIALLHAQGRKAMCYISAGSWEDWRPDANQFPAIVLGNNYDGWPGERWLDIRRLDLLGPILEARLDLCKSKGFDGVDPDNVNGFENSTGFPLTAQDQLTFNIWLANEAHARGLSIGLKNDTSQISSLLSYFDWALTEDCFAQGWCADLNPFITAGKPVFAVEYTDNSINFNSFCQQMTSLGQRGILKNRALDAFLQICP